MKERGILLPIFSLPSKYGIGDFGYEAYQFIDILSENEIDYWEILPINACGKYPYSPRSYFALEEMYISLDKLRTLKKLGINRLSVGVQSFDDEILSEIGRLHSSKEIYETIGIYLGYTLPYYAEFYDIKYLLLLGRVTSGKGGDIVIEKANEVLEKEFPEFHIQITVPDEYTRRVGQSIAAASLPKGR